jgi:SPX domain protein involved in polyphosphate accumulation
MVTIQEAEKLKNAMRAYLSPDDHGDLHGSYQLASLYYDSSDYRFYWEKLDGIKFRRKLRIRQYENGAPLTAETPVFVEIKQRLNRVTQKRRVRLHFRDALRLCNDREVPDHEPKDRPVIDEVLSMGWQYDLRPASVVTYARQALIGSAYDIGLRVTFDKDLRYRTNNLALDNPDTGQFLFPPEWVVMEIKVNERVPYWLTELVSYHNLSLMRVSKYCRSIEMSRQGDHLGYF